MIAGCQWATASGTYLTHSLMFAKIPPVENLIPFARRPASAADKLALPTRERRTVEAGGSGDQEPPLELSPAGRLLLIAAIFATALLTIIASHYSNLVATVWPANAIVLAALLCYRRTVANFVSIVIGGAGSTALASLAANNNAALSLTLMLANTTEIVTAFALLAAFKVRSSNLTSFNGILTFICVGAAVGPIASTFISATAFGTAFGSPWPVVWRNWYSGHALGLIIVVPFLVSVLSNEWQKVRVKERLSEAAAAFALFLTISVCVVYFRPFIFLLAPAILFATMRFGVVGATAATFLVAVIASVFVVLGIGEPIFLTQPLLSQRIFVLQAFLAITSFWSLPTAALLTERDRLLNDLSRVNGQLEAESERKSHLLIGLSRHLTTAEENERLRLSHELHDQAGQGLIAAILELNQIDSQMQGAPRDRLLSIRKKMEEMGKTLHRIAWELRPPSIDELGLRKALASYIAEWSEQCGTEVDFHCDDASLDAVPSEIATAVYRIVQECLTNVVKHAARPSSVSVVIRRTDAVLQVIVEDNGCGFDAAAVAAKSNGSSHRGLGFEGMRERLLLIGGMLEIESAPGAGTTIFARITLDGRRSAA
jgi:signal transduction histidine kinase